MHDRLVVYLILRGSVNSQTCTISSNYRFRVEGVSSFKVKEMRNH